MENKKMLVILLCLIGLVIGRPPAQHEMQQQQQQAELQFVDYFEDFFPVFLNSTKLKENYHYEKKKYLSTVLGLASKRMRMS